MNANTELRTNDNALAESKNTSIVRKYLDYSQIPQKWAPLINEFNQVHLNPYTILTTIALVSLPK